MNAPPKLRFTIEQYHQIGEAGILDPLVRTELLRGEIVTMPAKGTPHEVCLTRLNKFFVVSVGNQAIVRVQSPILLPPDSEPEPDFTIVRLRSDEYTCSHPVPEDILLLIEVSNSSLGIDRGLKLGLYAEYGIENYWIFNVQEYQLECYASPVRFANSHGGAVYQDRKVFTKADSVDVPTLPGVRLDLAQIFR